jgi:hypothetical protein
VFIAAYEWPCDDIRKIHNVIAGVRVARTVAHATVRRAVMYYVVYLTGPGRKLSPLTIPARAVLDCVRAGAPTCVAAVALRLTWGHHQVVSRGYGG